MPAKLIVTGLSEDVRDEELYDLFDVYGFIVDIGVDRGSVRARGYVVYEDAVSALRARLGMDGVEVNGQTLGVRPVCEDAGWGEAATVFDRETSPWQHDWK
ncbi:MAG: RNA-binding protein [Polyangiaceae bacterium]|nr:RNA-binding protein [Polyangiaceae bacterium]